MIDGKGVPPRAEYFKVKNDWFDALIRYRLPGRERQCLDFIIRRTYGWQKKEVELSINDFVMATGMVAPNVSRSLKMLKYKKIINSARVPGNRQVTYSFNKYFDQWGNSEVTKNDNFGNSEVTKNDNFGNSEVTKNDNLKLSKTITSNIKNDNFGQVTPIIVKDNIKTIKDKLHTSKKKGSKKTAKKSNNFHKKKARAVLKYFNKMKGSRYKDYAKISARLKDGGTVKDCILIINNKFADEYFQENPRFLNPTTLFRKSHWDKYLNDIPVRKIPKSMRTQYRNAQISEDWLNGK